MVIAFYTKLKEFGIRFFQSFFLFLFDKSSQKEQKKIGALATLTNLIIQINSEGIITEANELLCKLLSYGRNDIVGKNFNTFILNKTGKEEIYNLQNQRKTALPHKIILEIKTQSETSIWAEFTIFPSLTNGKVKFCLIGFEITSYVEKEKAMILDKAILNAKENELVEILTEVMHSQTVLEKEKQVALTTLQALQSEIYWFEFNADGNIIFINNLLLNFLEYADTKDIIGLRWTELLCEEIDQCLEADILKNERLSQLQTYVFKTSTFEEKYLDCLFVPILNDFGGGLQKILVLAIDKTKDLLQTIESSMNLAGIQAEEKLLEQSIKELTSVQEHLQSQNRFILNQLHGIWEAFAYCDLSPEGVIQTVNDEFCNLYGYKKEELEAVNISILNATEDIKKQHHKNIFDKLNQGQSVKGEFVRVHKNGKEIPIWGFYIPMKDENGQVQRATFLSALSVSEPTSMLLNRNSKGSLKNDDNLLPNNKIASKIKILLVEDESIIAMRTKELLLSEGFRHINICSSGEKAIILSRQIKPDVVLMDYALKGKLNGLDAGLEIHKMSGIPVIFITAFANSISSHLKPFHGSYFLEKPVNKEELLEILQSMN